ncbi:MAG: glycerol-3-phosphate acyltransferase [Oscillospiraceae bacterium]
MKLLNTFIFSSAGYLLGGLLFARYFSKLFCGSDVTVRGEDKNPGTYNAYTYGGFVCGALTLIFDLLKGFLPVFLYIQLTDGLDSFGLVLVMAAPILGHIFPIWHKFNGGKGIAVSFGVLLGLAPNMLPVLTLAITYLFLSFVVKINPHFYRIILTYCLTVLIVIVSTPGLPVILGCMAVSAGVVFKHIAVRDTYEKMQVKALWKR